MKTGIRNQTFTIILVICSARYIKSHHVIWYLVTGITGIKSGIKPRFWITLMRIESGALCKNEVCIDTILIVMRVLITLIKVRLALCDCSAISRDAVLRSVVLMCMCVRMHVWNYYIERVFSPSPRVVGKSVSHVVGKSVSVFPW